MEGCAAIIGAPSSTAERRTLMTAGESSMVLVRRAREGDSAALDDLCARYLPRLRRWAHGRLPGWARDGVDTQDLVQGTLVQVVKHIDAFEPRHEGAFQAYVRQALLNRIRDQIRRGQRHPAPTELPVEQPASDPSPLEEAIGRDLLDRYEAALQRLKADDHEAIVARIEMGLSWTEVAEVLGKNS